MMAFEKFTRARGSYIPRVTIRTTGQIGFSQGAVRRFSLREYPFCVLYCDRDAQAIAIQPTTDQNAEGAVRLTAKQAYGHVSARSFLAYYNVDFSKSRSFEVHWDNEMKAIIVDLKSEVDRRRQAR